MTSDREELIKYIGKSQGQILSLKSISRDYEDEIFKNIGSKPIKIVTGFRRSGKSHLVQRVAQRLVENKTYNIKNILYLNFESFQLSTINSPQRLNVAFETFLNSVAQDGKKLIIFDEIQNVKNWDKFIRTIYEYKDQDLEIILTGSNSELLSSELGSNLAGRFIEFYIQPFSFKESLNYHNIYINNENDFLLHFDKVEKLFYDYIKFGGLPETFNIQTENAKLSYIEGVLNKVILDDIIQRFKIRNPYILEKIIQYILANISRIISFKRITNFLKDLDLNIKENTVIDYVQYFIKSFALYDIQKFDWKTQKIFDSTKKYYSIDLGLNNIYGNLMCNFSRQLENLVYLELKRSPKIKNIYYGLDTKKEIDFIAFNKENDIFKYQITKTLNNQNQERELNAFIYSHKYLDKGENILLSLDRQEEDLEHEGIKIHKRNIMKWLILE